MTEFITEAEEGVVLKQAAELSQLFREVGPSCDIENRFAYETIQAYKDSGLGSVPIPKAHGGLGGTILTTSKVMTALSEGDSAIALAYNMHYITIGLCFGLLDEDQQAHWFKKVHDGAIMFGPISEARAGFSGLSDTKAVPQPGGGYKLYGQKNWGTLSEAADIIMTTATVTDADGNAPTDFEEWINNEFAFIADFDLDENGQGDGVRIEKVWDALGMHATGTQLIVFDGFFIPESGKGSEWRTGAFGVLEWASLLFASIYLGMCNRVLEESRKTLSKKTLGAVFGAVVAADVKVANVGHIIDGVGDMAQRTELSRRVLYRTCQELIDGDDDDWPVELRFPYIGLAKTFISENVMHMTKHAMSMVGGSSFRKGTIFERLYRDSAASMFQPLNSDQSRTYIGEYMLAPDELAD